MKLSLVCLEDNDNCLVFMKPQIVGFNFLIHAVKGHKRPVNMITIRFRIYLILAS